MTEPSLLRAGDVIHLSVCLHCTACGGDTMVTAPAVVNGKGDAVVNGDAIALVCKNGCGTDVVSRLTA